MDDRIRELIAVGASVIANCQPCYEYHAGKARGYGADWQEIQEAVLTAKMVRKGAASKMDQFVVLAAGDDKSALGAGGDVGKGCGCGQ